MKHVYILRTIRNLDCSRTGCRSPDRCYRLHIDRKSWTSLSLYTDTDQLWHHRPHSLPQLGHRNTAHTTWLHRWQYSVSVSLPDTSATRHFGIKTLRDTSAPISRHFDTKNVVRDTSTQVSWSRKSRDTSTQDNSDETQLHRWFVFGTIFVVPKCLGAEVSCGRSVRLPSVTATVTVSVKYRTTYLGSDVESFEKTTLLMGKYVV